MSKMDWFRQSKYGMFIHWGLYSALGGYWKGKRCPFVAEWIMRNLEIPLAEYSLLTNDFNPTEFDAESWVLRAKKYGMKYMVFTAKHHDGFSMYDSKYSDYNIVKATPYGRDVVRELADACKKHDMIFCLYYSQYQDWEDPDGNGNHWDYPDESAKDFSRYFYRKAMPQVEELLTNYGKLGYIWFDTPYEMPKNLCQELVDLVRKIQPDCLINSRVGYGLGDFREMSDNAIPVIPLQKPWQTPMTLNDTWGYSSTDENWKSPKMVKQMLVDICQNGGNLLLNVGPDALGVIPEGSLKILEEVGSWLKLNGESIYDTVAAPLFPYKLVWGGFTYKNRTLYMHIIEWPEFPYEIWVVELKTKVNKAYFLHDGSPVSFIQTHESGRNEYRLRVQFPEQPIKDAVVVLELDDDPEINEI